MAPGGSRIAAVRDETVIGGKTSRWSIKNCVVTGRLSSVDVGANPGPTWHVKGAEDFNGDGKADILWQDDSGQAMVWLLNGTTVLATGNVGANPGSPWHVTSNDDTLATGLAQISSANAAMDLSSQDPAHLVDHTVLFGGHLIF